MSVSWATPFRWRDRNSEWDQILFAGRGLLTVHTDAGLWVVPSHQAFWVPAGTRHDVETPAGVPLRAVYFKAGLSRVFKVRLPPLCRTLEVSPLLREVLRRIVRLLNLTMASAVDKNLLRVLFDELTVLPPVPLDLPMPRDPRGLRAAQLLRSPAGGSHRLEDVARLAAASPRTLERIFRIETGLPFGLWRQRARLVSALQLLADGSNVGSAASAVGYESTSAFVAAFRRSLGTTPGRYFRTLPPEEDLDPAASLPMLPRLRRARQI
jgi:AraC-like DNA-binding protein